MEKSYNICRETAAQLSKLEFSWIGRWVSENVQKIKTKKVVNLLNCSGSANKR